MDFLLLLKTFVALVVPFLLGMLARKLLSKRRASPQRNEEDVNPQRSEEDLNPGTPSPPIPPSDYDNKYEVFLSFSGGDTRKGFADHLYRSLMNAGIRVFRYEDGLLPGESFVQGLMKAIRSSKILIPIISANYASDKWCLNELVEMMKCKKQSGHIVLPIFYKVNPADARRERGSFGEAIRYHSKRSDREVVEEWKQALREVGSLRGWEIADGREGELIDSIVREVLNALSKAVELDVSENLVGIVSDLDKVMELIDESSGATVCVGIHGMAGIGKTTLVKVIYNKLSGQFVHRSFVADIRESCHRNGIVYLQNQLISDILGKGIEARSVDEGIKLIKSRFWAKKVLIILDDVDTIDQFKALAGNTNWFAPGSRILVTTRNVSVLERAGAFAKHELKEMNEEQSLILFSRHAFRSDSPPNDFSALAHVVASITGGLPLALEVVGSYLCGQPQKVWRKTIDKMQNMPHKAVRDKLMISYHALEEDQRQMFLDIACFLIGSETRVASYMWDACGFFPRLGIEILRSMSLIIIGDNHEFRMHSQLRDLGRDIVRAESYHEPHRRSRLWVYEEAMEVLEREKGSEMIQAVCLEKGNSTGFADEDDSDYQECRTFTPEQFERLPNLRFLHMSDVSLTGDFKGLLSELRWLKWGNCPSNFEATNLQAEELVILDLSGSKISDHWQGWRWMMMAKELKVLNLTGCRSLKSTFYLSAFKRLEILILRDCSELEGIDPRIGDMENLVSLDLRGCLRLTELPPQMAKLERLEELHLDGTAIQEIPSSISSLKNLETLSAEDCRLLRRLPASIGHFVNLSTLVLSGCVELAELPDSIGSLVNLHRLSLGHCHQLKKIPDSIGMLNSLTGLNLSGCSSLEELPPHLAELEQLKDLLLDRTMIREIPPSMGYLKNLETLSAKDCEFLVRLPDSISDLVNLSTLDLSGCVKLAELPHWIGHLENLSTLVLSGCVGLAELPYSIGSLVNLQCLSLGNCHRLREIPYSIRRLKLLTRLDLSGCSSLEELLPHLAELEQLKDLLLDRTMIREIPPSMGYLKNLETLSAKDCEFLVRLPDSISDLVNLSTLDLSGCVKLAQLPQSIGHLENLSTLVLSGCVELAELPDSIGSLVNLHRLSLGRCHQLKKIPDSIGMLNSLTQLDLSWTRIEELPESMRHLQNLEAVDIEHSSITELPDGVGRLKKLWE